MADNDQSKSMLERMKGLLGREERQTKRQATGGRKPAAKPTPVPAPAMAYARPVFETAHHPLADGCPPRWASGWGDDRYGVFVEFTLGEVTQRLRWIGPGRFKMGSPEDEPERYTEGKYNEGPQHEVRISKGFWLFDTPVTQALWTEVMGDNPSRFKDNPEHPVEQVSWDDAMQFIERLNGIIPDLDLVLPTEAQWEYAARAGTTTPFWWGSSINTDQANYDGNYPYAGGSKGEYRKKTVSVKTFQPNPWGLYQVHGNVWEWCDDDRREYSAEAVTDPVGSLDSTDRALRGGSWIYFARDVRAASRYAPHREDRFYGVGFRCARVRQ